MSATAIKQHQNGNQPQRTQNGLERERVTDIQRARMLAAMAEVACEHGASNVTVAHVVERAGVSRRTFYELFADREDCFLAAFEEAATRASKRVLHTYDPETNWTDRMRTSLLAFLSFLDEEPFMGRVLVVESLGAGPRALQRRQQALLPVAGAIDAGRGQEKKGMGPPPLTTEGVVGGVLAVLHARLVQDEPGSTLALANPLMAMIVLPYLGSAAARRELSRSLPRAPVPKPNASTAELNQLQIRLTYRTVRVLSAIAANPGSSNRKVADVSDIADQGQMSKLLARLQQLGLIENASAGSAARGQSNAWMLTSKGWQVQGALAHQVAS